MKTTGVMIVGVGGQGTLLASRILGNVIIAEGFDVKVSEVHGMSQRGGSVVTYVRFGDKVYSPVIDKGEADFIISFEKIEAARWVKCLKKGGKIIVNTQQIDPMPVVMGAAEYPDGIIEALKASGADIETVDALPMAVEAGNSKAVNVILIGAMAKNMPLDKEVWIKALKESVPPKFLELNKKAFQLGLEA